ncbi:unnamed protein product [Peronospora destructor]|uniref:Uncharacterized protein n=1 Tax=Peronospora destructor TaxID=86335 RepID=A0AAV0TAI5_9STRA|nr:unnamed protein product [Peronospora destructor]
MAALAASSSMALRFTICHRVRHCRNGLAEKGGSRKALSKDEDYRRRVELLQDSSLSSRLTFERGLDAEVVAGLEVLAADFGKLAFLQADRSVAFHAPYGHTIQRRIPKFGRDMTYHRENCEIYVAASGSDVYRINLDQAHGGVGCEDGVVEMFDSRSQQRVGSLDVAAQFTPAKSTSQLEVTALRDSMMTD